jgi:PIN domain
MRAHQLLNDPEIEFVGSEFLKLELLPIARFFGKKREVRLFTDFFDSIVLWAPSEILVSSALDLASEFGLGALDALHLCAAKHFNAEFVSAEKPTKPIYRAYSNITSIYED